MQQNFIRWQPFTAYLQTLNQSKYFFLGTQEHSFGLLFPEYTTLEACVPRTCGLVALCITLCCTDEQYAPIDTNRNASRFFAFSKQGQDHENFTIRPDYLWMYTFVSAARLFRLPKAALA